MPYYGAGDYYQGDNYAAGGLFSNIVKGIGSIAKRVIGATPVGQALNIVAPKLLGGGGGSGGVSVSRVAAPMIPVVPEPGISGFVHRIVPGGDTGLRVAGGFGGSRRRMNVTNVKALRRAGRRVKGFLKLARRLGALPVGGSGRKLFKTVRRRRK